MFIGIFKEAGPIDEFDVDLFFKLVEKIMVFDEGFLILSFFDKKEIKVIFHILKLSCNLYY